MLEHLTRASAQGSQKDNGIVQHPLQQGLFQQAVLAFTGQRFLEQDTENAEMGVNFLLALVLVYLVMASQFESFLHPFVIIFTLPLGAIGVILALAVTGHTINVVAIIGAVLLITVLATVWFMNAFGIDMQRISLGALIIALGMLVDNAIVVAEGMQIAMRRGKDSRAAADEAVRTGREVVIGPLTPAARREVHLALADDPAVETDLYCFP